jgi:hypothetical protein
VGWFERSGAISSDEFDAQIGILRAKIVEFLFAERTLAVHLIAA